MDNGVILLLLNPLKFQHLIPPTRVPLTNWKTHKSESVRSEPSSQPVARAICKKMSGLGGPRSGKNSARLVGGAEIGLRLDHDVHQRRMLGGAEGVAFA